MKSVFVFVVTFALVGVAGWLFWRQGQEIKNNSGVILDAVSKTSPSPYGSSIPTTSAPVVSRGVKLGNGLEIEDIVIGPGLEVRPGDIISVHYTGTLTDGKKFDSSLDRGEAFATILGVGKVIPGWDLGIPGMKVGGKRRLVIPSNLGYGPQGAGNIVPPNATLIFEIELLDARSGGQ
jgi:hypothetical protein